MRILAYHGATRGPSSLQQSIECSPRVSELPSTAENNYGPKHTSELSRGSLLFSACTCRRVRNTLLTERSRRQLRQLFDTFGFGHVLLEPGRQSFRKSFCLSLPDTFWPSRDHCSADRVWRRFSKVLPFAIEMRQTYSPGTVCQGSFRGIRFPRHTCRSDSLLTVWRVRDPETILRQSGER